MTATDAITAARTEDIQRRLDGKPTLLCLDEVRAECFLALSELIDGDHPWAFECAVHAAAITVTQRGLKVEFNRRFTNKMGDATFSLNRVRFSKPLWERAGYAQRRDTIRHEVAHLVAQIVEPGTGHGATWQRVAKMMDCKAEQYHHVPLADLRRRNRRYPAKCNCMTHQITGIRRNRMLKGGTYVHPKCGGTLRLVNDDDI